MPAPIAHHRTLLVILLLVGCAKQAPSAAGESPPLVEVSAAALGATVFAEQGCVACHTIDGSPSVGPSLLGVAGSWRPIQGRDAVLADEDYLRRAILVPAAEMTEGFPIDSPSYEGHLTDEELRALVAYLQCLGDAPPEVDCAGVATP